MTIRVPINKFAVANKGYRGALVYVFTVDDDFAKTNTLAVLYDGPTGTGQLANPITLDSAGKFTTIPYVETSIICTVNSMDFGEHDTGLVRVPGGWEGDWGPGTVYQADDLVKDGLAGNDSGNVYICLVPHESGTVFQTDLDAGYWALIFDLGDAALSAEEARDWAIKTGAPVSGSDYSAKEYAVGVTPDMAGSSKEWAQRAHGSTVPGGGGEFSSKHYATEAAGQATLAAAHASDAADYLSDAADQATLSGAWATEAAGQATLAGSHASDALTHAGDAQTAETAAEAAQALAEAAANSLSIRTVVTFSGNYTATDADRNKLLVYIGTGGHTVDWDNATLSAQTEFIIGHEGSGNLTLNPASTNTVDGSSTIVLTNKHYVAVARLSATQSLVLWARGYGIPSTPISVANGGTGATDAAGARTALGLAIGSDVQAYDADLAALAGITSGADRLPYFTGVGTAAYTVLTVAARGLLNDTSTAEMRSTLNVVPGTDVQAYDADLAALAALSSTGLIARTGAGTVAARSITGAGTVTVTGGDGVSGDVTVTGGGGSQTIRTITGNDTLSNSDKGKLCVVTADATLAIDAISGLDSDWQVDVIRSCEYNDFGYVKIDPNASEEVDEQTTIIGYANERFRIRKQSTFFRTDRGSEVFFGESTMSGATVELYAAGLFLDDPEIDAVTVLMVGASHGSTGNTRSPQMTFRGTSAYYTSSGDYNLGTLTSFATPAGTESSTVGQINLTETDIGDTVSCSAFVEAWKSEVPGTDQALARVARWRDGTVPDIMWCTIDGPITGIRFTWTGSQSYDAGALRYRGTRMRKS